MTSRSLPSSARSAPPDKQRPERRNQPEAPASYQRTLGCEQATLDAVGPEAYTGEEIDRVVQWAAELEAEGFDRHPCRRRKGKSKRDVSAGRSDDKDGEISYRPSAGRARKPYQRGTPEGHKPAQRGGGQIGYQQQP